MSIAIVTGSIGLVGAAAVRRLAEMGLDVIGIDNDMRRTYFGEAASNSSTKNSLEASCRGYRHFDIDIRNTTEVDRLFESIGNGLRAVVHAAAQPSHDWAATDPLTDFAVNATATLNLLETCRRTSPEATFVFVSTNKVYGDHPNQLPLVDAGSRMEVSKSHPFHTRGIDESMSIDQTRHSLFGVSKTSADLLVQEYAARFGMHTVVFRAGCITGEDHHGAKAHGFLSYLCRVARDGTPYEVIGHEGKQVRDNLHAGDLADAVARVIERGGKSGVYNMGGGRKGSCSVIEALDIAGAHLDREIERSFTTTPRYGDHIWWISDTSRFEADYPGWAPTHSAADLIARMLTE